MSRQQNSVKKKSKLRSATDVINRVQWDPVIPQEHILVGYLDRFSGVLEKPFSAFSWEPLDSQDYYTLGIPRHRIQYFKYKEIVIWDKNKRLDHVFGSSNSQTSLHDIIANYENFVLELIPVKQIDEHSDSADESDDGINIVLGNISDVEAEPDHSDGYWTNIMRPNFFICLRIDSPLFIQVADRVQKAICRSQPAYESCCTPPELFHLTLQTLRLYDASQVSDCIQALQEAKEEFRDLLPKFPINVKGVKNFHDRVIYAAVDEDPNLAKLVDHINLVLRSVGIRIGDGRDFTPHISLVKVSKKSQEKYNLICSTACKKDGGNFTELYKKSELVYNVDLTEVCKFIGQCNYRCISCRHIHGVIKQHNRSQINRCLRMLQEAKTELQALTPRSPISFKGLGHFGHSVLYASVVADDDLNKMVARLGELLDSAGIYRDTKHGYTPHITLLKVTEQNRLLQIFASNISRLVNMNESQKHASEREK